jgi:tetratricopeptide (TPR) repeat protein
MRDALYERYKDALRRGHPAAQRARPDAGLAAYGEAAQLAPDRAWPVVGVAGVLNRLGRDRDAIAAYAAALDRAPGDEAALRGQAELLAATGDRVGAAETLDRLAETLDAAGRLADATDVARQALEAAESRNRRATVRVYIDRLQMAPLDPANTSILAAARRTLDGAVADGSVPGEGSTDTGAAGGSTLGSPFIPGMATARVEEAIVQGDHDAARRLALEAWAGHRANGAEAAAIDACYLALADHPDDPDLHLALAASYLDRGWRSLAGDKLVLLARLADLTEDRETHDRVCRLLGDRLPDEPRRTVVCA